MILHEWQATCRCDCEEYFCTETFYYKLETSDFAIAIDFIEHEIGYNYTLISLERIV